MDSSRGPIQWGRRAAIAFCTTALVAGTAGVLVPGVAAAAAASFYASASGSGTNCSQASPCNLATALIQAHAGDTILLVTPGSNAHYVGNWVVKTSSTTAAKPLTIQPAPGVTQPVLDGNLGNSAGCSTTQCNAPILDIQSGTSLTVKNFEIYHAQPATGFGHGGGISNNTGGTMVVSGMNFVSNHSFLTGGAIANATGAANATGTLTVTDSTFQQNEVSGGNGGAIENGGYGGKGNATISASTFLFNGAAGGGAISHSDDVGNGTLTVTRSTFYFNNSTNGGAIDVGDQFGLGTGGGGQANITASTFKMNSASSGRDIDNNDADAGTAVVTVAANIFADTNGGFTACNKGGTKSGLWQDNGYNVGADSSCFHSGTGDVTDAAVASELGDLANNGGPTQTIGLLAGNPAIALIPNPKAGLCPTTDQRGMTSPVGGKCNSGAVQPGSSTTAPNAPTGLTATPGNGQITLNWTAPSSNGGAAITGYKVYEGTTAGGENLTTAVCTVSATTCVVSSLTNGTTYFFKVLATNAVGDSALSNETSATPLGVPGAPTGLTATPGNGQVTLNWTAPSSNGGSAITGYKVYEGTTTGGENLTTPVCSGNTTSCAVTGLTNGTTYFFKVVATNTVGDSALSNETSATPATVPGSPVLSATPGNGQVTLNWTAPSSNGGSAITGYKVYEGTTAGGENLTTPVCTVSATTCAVTGLTNGTTYFFKVLATNAVGDSALSNEASATPLGVPDAPTGLTATPGNGQVGLSWTAPSSNGGSAITGYKVYEGTTTGGENLTTPVCTVSATTCAVTGLTNGTTYFFKVLATNANGDGGLSNEASATPATAPSAPTGLTATPGNGQVTLNWTAPSSTGGSAITGYKVYEGTTTGGENLATPVCSGTTTSCTVTGLTNGTPYFFKVLATNTVGDERAVQRGLGHAGLRPWFADDSYRHTGQWPGRPELDRTVIHRRIGHHRLQGLRRHHDRRRKPHHPGVQRHHHVMHRDRPHQRHRLLLQGAGHQHSRRQRPLQRGLGHPGQRARRAHRPDRKTRGRPGHAELDRTVIERRIGHHRLQGLRRHHRRRREPHHPGVHRQRDNLCRDRPHQRHHLFLHGAGHQRSRRQRPLQ